MSRGWRPESDVITRHLRLENAVYGPPIALPVCRVTCTFLVTLPGDPMKMMPSEKILLACSDDHDLLERVRQNLIEMGGDCGEITDPPTRTGEDLRMRFKDFDTYYNINDGKSWHLLKESVRTGQRCWH